MAPADAAWTAQHAMDHMYGIEAGLYDWRTALENVKFSLSPNAV